MEVNRKGFALKTNTVLVFVLVTVQLFYFLMQSKYPKSKCRSARNARTLDFRRISCGSCSLFNSHGDMTVSENECGWEHIVKNIRCSKRHHGPYYIIGPLWAGLHNSWLLLFSSLFFGSAWGETGGTIVIPGISASRKNFQKENYAKFIAVRTEEIFDVEHLVLYLRRRFNVNACISKGPPKNIPDYYGGTYDDILKEIQSFGSKTGEVKGVNLKIFSKPSNNASSILKMVPDHGNVTLIKTGNFITKFRYTSPDLEDVNDPHISAMRDTALSICFARNIRELAAETIEFMRGTVMMKRIIGLHIRLEGDWTHEAWGEEKTNDLLKSYEHEIQKFETWSPHSVALYVAHGDLSNTAKALLDSWLDGLNLTTFRKEETLSDIGRQSMLSLTPEARGAVDAEVLVNLDHFIGLNASSMAYVVKEKRRYLGKPTAILELPYLNGYPFWYPIYVPAKADLFHKH